jgi:hypothetical protein
MYSKYTTLKDKIVRFQVNERWGYSAPSVELVEVSVEVGFSMSGRTEDVDRDEEIEF